MNRTSKYAVASFRALCNKYCIRQLHYSGVKHSAAFNASNTFTSPSSYERFIPIRYTQQWLQKEQRKEYTISVEELKQFVDNDEVYLVDVRESSEVEAGRVPSKRYVNIPVGTIFQALQLPKEEFEKKFGSPKPEKDAADIVFMCRSGVRSTFALQAGQSMGYTKSKHFIGGWLEWDKLYGKKGL